jgi:pyrroloquinoline quinone (PQQ) biosynthesis protein C
MSSAFLHEVEGGLSRIKSHPFLVAASAGGLPKEAAERWVFCAGRESRSFPGLLSGLIRRASSTQMVSVLQQNLNDELGNGNSDEAHFRHYLQLLDELKIPRSEFDSYSEGPGITLALALADTIATAASEPVALGYMVLNEAVTPLAYRAAQQALEAHFEKLSSRFFDLHVAVDAEHVRALETLITEAKGYRDEDLCYGVSLGERGMQSLLDEAYGLYNCPGPM